MLQNKFRHRAWFNGSSMTVKDFLDYVASRDGYSYFSLRSKFKSKEGSLFDGDYEIYLTGEGGSYKLDAEDQAYLSEHNEYFRERLEGLRNAS